MNSKLIFPSQPFFEGKNHFVQLLFLLLFTIGGMLIFSALSLVVTKLCLGEDTLIHPTADSYRLMQVLSAGGTFLLPALLFSYCSKKNCFSFSLSQQLPKDKIYFGYVLILGFTLIPCIAILVLANKMIPIPDQLAQAFDELEYANNQILEVILSDNSWGGLILNIFVCAVFPAICEEFFFRGTLQNFCQDWFKNKHVAIWITAFIFSAIHFQFSGFLARMFLGAYLGYLFIWSRSLWVPIAAHFLNNVIAVITTFVNPESIHDEADLFFATEMATSDYVLIISGIIMTAIFLFYSYKKRDTELSESSSN